MLITRTNDTDDDGTGTTGTIRDAAWKDEVYDQIDAVVAGAVQSTTSIGNQDDFALSAHCGVLRCNNASLLTIRGLAAGVDGQRLTILSVGAGQVDLANQDSNSAAANRIINGVTGTRSLAAGSGSATLVYDDTTDRWRVIEHEQGAWITPAFDAGDYTGNDSMTWTVESSDVLMFRYRVVGQSLHVIFTIDSTTVGGTPSSQLMRNIPGGFTWAGDHRPPMLRSDAGTAGVGEVLAGAIAGKIVWRKNPFGGDAWSVATNTTSLQGEFIAPIA